MKNYLFIGGAGFIGSSIIKQIAKCDGSPNITVIEPPEADVARLKGVNVRLVRGTISDTWLIEQLIVRHHVGTVVHLVSGIGNDGTDEDYQRELRQVVQPTIELAKLCGERHVRLVYFSSGGAVYGESADGCSHRETDTPNPKSYYGMAKLIVESNLRFYHRISGLQYLILRPSNPYGPGQNTHGRQGLIAVALGRARDGQTLTVWGDGSQVRDYIYIDDLAKAVCAVMESGVQNETINIGGGEGLSVGDVIAHINDVCPQPLRVEYAQERQGDVAASVLDVARMRQFWHQPLTPIRSGIRTFWNSL